VGIDNPAAPDQRFPPYYAEVRPFFIENSSYFMTPINLYYTNNIVTPQLGARLTGKLGAGRWAFSESMTAALARPCRLQILTPILERTCMSPAFNRDVGALSDVGLIYADREYLGSFNRAGGLDYRARINDRWTFTGQALTSQTQNLSNDTQGEQTCESLALTCSGQAYTTQASYTDLHHNWWAAYNDIAAGFVTDTGFFERPDVRQPSAHYSYTFRPMHGPLLSHGLSI